MAMSTTMGQRLTGFDPAKLKEARKAAGLSQGVLAARIGAHFTSISDWERGVNQPSARHLASLSDALRVPMDFFRREPGEDRASVTDAAA